jgi:hypothetical protein
MNTDLTRVQAIASIVLTASTVATLVVLIIYTILTYGLRNAAVGQVAAANKQNENSFLPVVVLDVDSKGRLVIRNVGAGPAFDVGDIRIMVGSEKRFLNHQALIPAGADS